MSRTFKFLDIQKNVSISKKNAFTLLEMVFVIVVVGILAATMAPRFTRDSLQEAADKLAAHIRYTKHLALIDDKFDTNDSAWYKERWQLIFTQNVNTVKVWSYTIFSDINHDGNPNINDQIAKDPTDANKFLSGGYSGIISLTDKRRDSTMALREKYGIEDVNFTGGCSSAKRIAFDYLGRPIIGNQASMEARYKGGPGSRRRIMETTCKIKLCLQTGCTGDSITVAVEPVTGYVHIL